MEFYWGSWDMCYPFYPAWYTPASPEYSLWAPKAAFGGVPSLAFLPKLPAEIGLFGAIGLIYGVFSRFRSYMNALKSNNQAKKWFWSFAGFLLASLGIEGYLYLPAWLILGLLLGLSRVPPQKAES